MKRLAFVTMLVVLSALLSFGMGFASSSERTQKENKNPGD